MPEKTEVVVCLGSSCFSRGNKKVVSVVDDYIRKHGLEDQVFFHGNHCFSNCSYGPVLKVGETIYTAVNPVSAVDILDKHFKNTTG
jgi:NADH:ubiquinone oxidoreductase subunit E